MARIGILLAGFLSLGILTRYCQMFHTTALVTPAVQQAALDVPVSRGAKLQQMLNQILEHETIRFAHNSDEILDESRPLLNDLAAQLKAEPAFQIEIQGHTDSTGDSEANIELSLRRAKSVVRSLVAREIPKNRLHPKADGPSAIKNQHITFNVLGGK